MPNYKETSVVGEMRQWRRAENIVISNPYGGVATITFNEENKISLPDGAIMPGPGVTDPKLVVEFSDPLTEFNLISPIDGAIVGTAKYLDIYVILYSLYTQMAVKRDEEMKRAEELKMATEIPI